MKIQIRKWGALLFAAVMLLVSVPPVPVQAETVGSLEKTLDMTLVKLGIVCDENGLTSIANNLYDTAIGDVQDFDEYCVTNELNPVDASAYESWKETREYQNRLLDMVMETKYRKAAEDGTEVTLDFTKDDMNDAIHGGDGLERGKEYTIDEDTVSQMHNAFQNWWSENGDYYLVRTRAFSDLHDIDIITIADEYHEYKEFLEKIDESVYYLHPHQYRGKQMLFQLTSLEPDGVIYVSSGKFGTSNYVMENVALRAEDSNFEYVNFKQTAYLGDRAKSSYYASDYAFADFDISTYFVSETNSASGIYHVKGLQGLYSKYPRNFKIYKSQAKARDVIEGENIVNVYYSTSYDYSVTNTVTYSGDYYCDTSGVYNFGTVQDSINNIEGDVTDSIIDSTVDQSVTNITNNYITNVSGGDGSGDSSGDDDGEGGIFDRLINALGDALGNILGLFEELLDLFLSAIVDAIGIIAQGLTGAVEKLRGLSVQVEGLTGFFKEFFSFVPVDYWDMVSSLMLISFVVVVVKLLKK